MDQPWKVALVRGVVTAVLLGASGALAMWSQTEEARQIAIAGLTPFVGALLLRFGGEGALDSRSNAG